VNFTFNKVYYSFNLIINWPRIVFFKVIIIRIYLIMKLNTVSTMVMVPI
jgi:hypothetical protein